ncbi:MAG: YIP1 family protein [Acidobacteria bacterium]|nr:YIP1 family protein [Acidobacteriota bacterium]
MVGTLNTNSPALADRVKNIITDPKAEWPVIEREQTTVEKLYREYIALLAAIPVLASMIGSVVFGLTVPFVGTIRTPVVQAVITAIFTYVLALVGVYLAAFIVDKLAPTFDSKPDQLQALKLVAYAYTPAWIAGVLNIIPVLGILAFLGGLYSIYVFYLGLPVMMKTPEAKVIPYMVVAAVVIIIVSFVMMAIAGMLTAGFAFMY